MIGELHDLSFCEGLISLSIVSSGFIHIVHTADLLSFFKTEYHPIVCIFHIFFVHLSGDKHFNILTIVNLDRNEMSPHTCLDAYCQKNKRLARVCWPGRGEIRVLYSVGGNVKWCNLDGKQYGGSTKIKYRTTVDSTSPISRCIWRNFNQDPEWNGNSFVLSTCYFFFSFWQSVSKLCHNQQERISFPLWNPWVWRMPLFSSHFFYSSRKEKPKKQNLPDGP